MRSALTAIVLLLACAAAAAEEAPAPADEAAFSVTRNGKTLGVETMTVPERSPARARYVSEVALERSTAFRGELVTGPEGAATSYKVKGRLDGHELELDAFVLDDKMEFHLTRDGAERRFKVKVPLLCMAFDGELAAHWQSLVDTLDGEGPWRRATIAPLVMRHVPLSIARKKTAATASREGKARPLALFEVKGVKTARVYATREGMVVLVEIPADGYVLKRKGWTVKR